MTSERDIVIVVATVVVHHVGVDAQDLLCETFAAALDPVEVLLPANRFCLGELPDQLSPKVLR